MLIKLSESETVITPLPRFGMRAFLTVPVQAGPSAMLSARSARPSAAAKQQPCVHVRTGDAGLHLIGQAANYMTRISATGEGASGPHPAREPEPV
ncbi:MAG: hypothetical protein M3Y33_22265 [Actinomycetota bacterium]|nr:hypothetical protein [Actinomycetota bacterium]